MSGGVGSAAWRDADAGTARPRDGEGWGWAPATATNGELAGSAPKGRGGGRFAGGCCGQFRQREVTLRERGRRTRREGGGGTGGESGRGGEGGGRGGKEETAALCQLRHVIPVDPFVTSSS